MTENTLLINFCLIYNVIIFILCIFVTEMECFYRYVPEGNMTACGTDYLNKSWKSRSYILIYSIFVYFLPLFIIIYAYSHIVKVKYVWNSVFAMQRD